MKKLYWIGALVLVLLLGGTAMAEEAFVHPGLLHTQADLDRVAKAVADGEQPYLDGWNKLLESGFAKSGVQARATETIIRGGEGNNCALLYQDCARAYQCALRWRISGDTACGDTARDILNAWSATLKTVSGNADRYLASGLYGYQLANASELMRDYPGFELARMQEMLLRVFYEPLCERFLYSNEYGSDHNGAYITNYWANWDLANMTGALAIGVFCDRRDIYDRAVEYFKNGAGNGSIYNAVPYLYPGSLGQWQEAGRDQGHATLGIGLMGTMCEMAWSQGDDLYGWADNRFLHGAEYVARYNNEKEVPYSNYEWGQGVNGDLKSQPGVSPAGRGSTRPIWEMVYNHYVNRMGYKAPNITEAVEKIRPEGGPGGHASSFDQTGFGTLMFTRPAGGVEQPEAEPGNVAEGVYRLIVQHSQKALTGNGTMATQATVGTAGQEWIVAHLGGGQYTITNAESGLSLSIARQGDLLNPCYDSGAAVELRAFTNDMDQKFAFVSVKAEDCFRITPIHTNKPIDVLSSSQEDHASMVQWRYVLGANQHWKLELIRAEDTVPPTNVAADQNYVTVNGLRINASPIMQNDRLLAPLRAVFEALDGTVEWDEATQTVRGARGEQSFELQIGNPFCTANGNAITLDVPAQLIDESTMVPLRFVAEALGATVSWNEATATAEILL